MRNARVWMVMMTLTAAGLACALPGGPKPPASPIAVSTAAATQMQETVQTAVADAAKSGQLDLTLTEEQVTSYVVVQLAQQADAPITDLQIFLRDNKIQMFGTVTAGQVTAKAQILIAVAVDAQGKLALTIEKADFGPIPVPKSLLENISTALDKALTQQIGGKAVLSGVSIVNGQITLTGTVSK
jgi:hypothetical protein